MNIKDRFNIANYAQKYSYEIKAILGLNILLIKA